MIGGGGGCSPKKNQKNQSLHQNRQIGIGFFWFFLVFFWFFKISKLALVFFGFFWHWFWPEFEIGNCFFLVFFWVFLVFFGFFLA